MYKPELWPEGDIYPVQLAAQERSYRGRRCHRCGGELRTVCPIKEVKAFQGDDVWLQCHTDPQTNLSQLTVDWHRPNLGHYVYVYRNHKDDPGLLLDQYRGRMKVDHGGLHRGNLTLFIPSVTPSDSGLYGSFIPRHGAGCRVQLTVVNRTRGEVFSTATPSSTASHRDAVTPAGTAVIVTVCIVVAVVVVVVVLLVKCGLIGTRRMRRREETTPSDPDKEILNGVVTGGDDSNRSPVVSQQLIGLSRAS